MKPRFNLVKSKAVHIRLVFRYSGSRLVYYPGIQINQSDWNSKTQRIRKGCTDWQEINGALDRLHDLCLTIYRAHLASGELLQTDLFKLKLDREFKGIRSMDESQTLAAYILRFAAAKERGGQMKGGTTKGFRSLSGIISRFDKSATFESVNMDFHRRLVEYLTKQGKAPNTIHSVVKRLKRVMSEAFDSGLTQNQAFRSRSFTAKQTEADTVYLTEHEVGLLHELYNVEQSDSLALFLLGCYTGLRYSDFSSLRAEDFREHDGVLIVRKRMTKTGRVVAAPITLQALSILSKYDMQPPTVTNQVLNRVVKQCCKRAGIADMVKVEMVRGGKQVIQVLPKWRLVSSHTARRTFATLGYLRAVAAGVSYDPVMDILGHKSRATFLKYIRVSAESKAASYAKAGLG